MKKEGVAYILLSTADKIKGQTGSVFTVHLENGGENDRVQEMETAKAARVISYMFSEEKVTATIDDRKIAG